VDTAADARPRPPLLRRIRYTWNGEPRERCFGVVDGEPVPVACPESPMSVAPRPGLGDLVAATTEALGIPPCPPCMARKKALNQATPGIVRRALAWIAVPISASLKK